MYDFWRWFYAEAPAKYTLPVIMLTVFLLIGVFS